MTYSYTQISQYLTCPRRYRHRYLDGWKEKDTRAAMLFGRAFERALSAYFRREDPGAVLFSEWSACQSQGLHYSNGDSWDRMLRQGIMLLDRFCQDDRIQVREPRRNLQIKFRLPGERARTHCGQVDEYKCSRIQQRSVTCSRIQHRAGESNQSRRPRADNRDHPALPSEEERCCQPGMACLPFRHDPHRSSRA